MILSVSRRTDISAFYADWFFNRIKAGYVLTRNPMNYHQVSRIELSPEVVDCIVFWTKNPAPMLHRLDEIKDYSYYFQVSITPYDHRIESNVPAPEKVIDAFVAFSKRIGSHRMVWRYDPIILTKGMDVSDHLQAFKTMAKALEGYTDTCVISFVDHYVKIQKAMQAMGVKPISDEVMLYLAERLSKIGAHYGIALKACSETLDMSHVGVVQSSCIDQDRIEAIIHKPMNVRLDSNQREACGCIESIDIGAYHSCQHGCAYCYATDVLRADKVEHFSKGPMLIGDIQQEDIIKERKMVSLVDSYIQMTLE